MRMQVRMKIAGLILLLGWMETLMAKNCQELSYETTEGDRMQTRDCDDRDPARGSLVPLLSCLPGRKPEMGAWGGSSLSTTRKVVLPDGKVELLNRGLQWTSNLGSSQTEIYYELIQRKESKKEGESTIELHLKELFTLDYREDKVQRLEPAQAETQILTIRMVPSPQGLTLKSVVTDRGISYTCARGRIHERLLSL